MPKNKLSEIDEILAKSQRLAASFTDGSQSTRNLSRGIFELNEATKQFTQTSTRDQHFADSFTVLNQKTKKLYDDVNAIMFDVRDDSVDALESMDLDAYLNHHEEMTILSVIEESNKLADESMQEMQQRWAADEWATAKTQFMESLGHRSYQWEGSGNSTARTNNAQGDHSVYEGHGHNNSSLTVFNTPAARAFTPSSSSALQASGSNFNVSSLMTRNSSALVLTPARPVASTSYTMTPGSTTIAEALGRLRGRPAHSDFLSAHTMIVRELQLKAREKSSRRVAPCAELSRAINVPQHLPAKGIVTDGLTKADLLSYKSLLDFLSSVVGESEEIAPGHYSPVAFDAGECYAGLQEERRAQLTAGAKSFLEKQIYDIWSHAVDSAVADGELSVSPSTDGKTRLQRLKAYVCYQYRVGAIPNDTCKAMCPQVAAASSAVHTLATSHAGRVLGGYAQSALVTSTSRLAEPLREGAVPLWAYVYHCLRVGELQYAQSELASCANFGYRAGETEAAAALNSMIALQNSSTQSKSTAAADAAKKSLVEHVSICRALYDAEMSSAASQQHEGEECSSDPYRLVVLNLLGLADKDALANSPVQGFSLEDFLWANLWFVQVTKRAGGVSNSGETDLFELIQSYGGAEYFDQDRSTPFKYATVLFCCQRYGDAVAHLWATNKTVPAVHLTIICLYYGLVLPHSPLSQNPGHPLVNNRVSTSGGADPTPATVLQVFFSSNVFQHYPELAADYLMSLDSNWLPAAGGLESELREVHKLRSQATFSAAMEAFILQQDRETLTVIVGQPSDNEALSRGEAVRTPGRLDDYLQVVQIDLLLSRSAYHLLTQRRESEGAIYLYQLAGRYSDVLDEMCTQLSGVLVPPSLAYGQQVPTTQLQQHQQQQLFATQQAVREHWRQVADSFIQKYLRGVNNTHSVVLHRLTQSGHQDLVEALITLTQLFQVVDAFCAQQFDQALELLDGLNVLPTSDSAVEVCAKTQPHLLRVMDDLLILSAESSRAVFQQLRAARGTVVSTSQFGSGHLTTPLKSGGAGGGQGLLTDKDIRMQSLKGRVHTLVTFANRMKGKLSRHDTTNIVARIEATFL